MGTISDEEQPAATQPLKASFAEGVQEVEDTSERIAKSPDRMRLPLASMNKPGQHSDKSPRQGSRYNSLRSVLREFPLLIMFMEALENPNSRNLQAIIGYGTSGIIPPMDANTLAAIEKMKQDALKIKFNGNEEGSVYLRGTEQPIVCLKIDPEMAKLIKEFLSIYTECKYVLFDLGEQWTIVVTLFMSYKSQNLKAIVEPVERTDGMPINKVKDKGQIAFWKKECENREMLTLEPNCELLEGPWYPIEMEKLEIVASWPQYNIHELDLKFEPRIAPKSKQGNSRSPTGPSGSKSGTTFHMLPENSRSVTPTPSSGSVTPPRKGIFGSLMSASPRRSSRANEQHGQPVVNHECLASFGDAIGAEEPIDGDKS